jgi:hypothetical protein
VKAAEVHVAEGPCANGRDWARADTSLWVHYLRLWACGFLIAFGLVIVLSPYFISSLRIYVWSPEIGDYVLNEGYVHRERSEGWAVTRYGPLGLSGTSAGASASARTVMIWGDSFIEAHSVNDAQKVNHQVTEMLSQQGRTPITAVAVGHSYWSVADYYYNLPSYERLFHPICHFIVLAEHGLADLCPDGERFLATPAPQFVRRAKVDVRKNRTMVWLRRRGLQDVVLAPWKAWDNVVQKSRCVRFSLGPRPSREPAELHDARRYLADGVDPNAVVPSWIYALEMLRSHTAAPVVLVLVPEVPTLRNGSVCGVNPQSRYSERLADLCRQRGIDYLDLTKTLVGDYLATGRLSRGFDNGQPGCGHLNSRGHYLLSQQICAYLRSHFADSL